MMWDFGWWGWAWMLGGTLMMLLFWGGLFLLVFLAVRGLSTNSGSRPQLDAHRTPNAPEPTALEILKARYARGEISREEYEQIRRDLETT